MENKKNNEENKENLLKPSEEEFQKIFYKFNEYLTNFNIPNIKEVTDYFCEQYNFFKDYFFESFLMLILEKLSKEQKIEYLYLMIEIIKALYSNTPNNNITDNELSYLLSGVREICKFYHYSMNNEFIKLVKKALNHLKDTKIYDEKYINNIIMELRITTDPKITYKENDINDITCLMDLFNEQTLQIDMNMINLYKDIKLVERGNINKLRMNLIKKENDLIEKQMLLYNKNLEQIKNINEMIDIIDKKFPGIK